MPDLIQETYEILNHYLGETNNRNLKRLPEKYEELRNAIENLVAYAYQFGLIVGQDKVNKEVYQLFRQFDRIPRYPKYKRLAPEEKK